MLKLINLGNRENTLEILNKIKEKNYVPFDVEIRNSHISTLNKVIGEKIFNNNLLFIVDCIY